MSTSPLSQPSPRIGCRARLECLRNLTSRSIRAINSGANHAETGNPSAHVPETDPCVRIRRFEIHSCVTRLNTVPQLGTLPAQRVSLLRIHRETYPRLARSYFNSWLNRLTLSVTQLLLTLLPSSAFLVCVGASNQKRRSVTSRSALGIRPKFSSLHHLSLYDLSFSFLLPQCAA